MLTKNKHRKRLIAFLCVLTLHATGCVSIRQAPKRSLSTVANCGMSSEAKSEECCELYDRRVVVKRWAQQLNPVQLVPQGVSEWISQQPGRCSAMKASVQGWIHKKKEESNPPPWPRFHPVPTKPVFESEEVDSALTPEIYGRFGKG